MHFIPKLPSGTFSYIIIVSVFQILEPSRFVEFGASFWVLFLVILSPVMEKTAKRNKQKKKTKKTSASSPDESRKLQFRGGGPLIKQSKLAAHRTKPGPGPRLDDQGRQQRTRNRRTRPKPGNLTHPCAKRGGGYACICLYTHTYIYIYIYAYIVLHCKNKT